VEYEDFSQDTGSIEPKMMSATPEEAIAWWSSLKESQRIAVRAYEKAADVPGNPTPAQIIALWRHGKIPRDGAFGWKLTSISLPRRPMQSTM